MAESLRKAAGETAPELRLPDRPRPEQLVERHREWIAATTAAPYRRRQRRRSRGFPAASLVFPGAVGLAVVAVLLAVTITQRADDGGAPLRDQLIPGGSGAGAVWKAKKSVVPATQARALREPDRSRRRAAQERGGADAERGTEAPTASPRLPPARTVED